MSSGRFEPLYIRQAFSSGANGDWIDTKGGSEVSFGLDWILSSAPATHSVSFAGSNFSVEDPLGGTNLGVVSLTPTLIVSPLALTTTGTALYILRDIPRYVRISGWSWTGASGVNSNAAAFVR